MAEKITQEQKIWGAVSYLWILSLVALAARKDDEFIRFHANQGAFLFVVSLVLMFVPFIGWMINILLTLVAIVAFLNALQGQKWELPLVGKMPKQLGDWIIKTMKI